MENLKNQFEMFENTPKSMLVEVPADRPQPEKSILDEMRAETDTAGMFTSQPQPQASQQPNFNPGNQNQGFTQPLQMGNNLKLGNLINAEMFVGLMDTVLPAILIGILQKMMAVKVAKSTMQLSAREKDIIVPLMDKVLMEMNIQVDSPLNALLISLAAIYGTKLMEVLPAAMEAKKQAKNAPGENQAPGQKVGYNLPTGKGSRGSYKKKQ